MKNLPPEILPQIFILLYQQDQLECMLTCCLWKNIIEDSCLFRTLYVYSYSFLEKITKKIQEQPRLGNNIQQLSFLVKEPGQPHLAPFLENLPNLRKLRIYFSFFGRRSNNSSLKVPWRSHIESIEEVCDHRIILSLLSNNVFPNLTFLHVSEKCSKLIPFLKNAPALKTFTVEGDYGDPDTIQLDSINKIHEHLPNLKMLSLKNIIIDQNPTERGIVPANSITGLYLLKVYLSSFDLELRFLQFITKKYPNLVDLGYETTFSPTSQQEDDTFYNNGLEPLIQTLGPQLKTLRTNFINRFQGLLPVLDRHNCQIEHLKMHYFPRNIFPNFVQSQQSLYIRTLILSHVRFDSITWLKELKVLEVLEILVDLSYDRLCLHFNDLLNNSSSTLTSLTFQNIHFTGEVVSARQYNVKSLSFIRCHLPPNISWFIDRHFPLITNLKLKTCDNLPKEITLRSAELDSFCLICRYTTYPIHILVRTIYDGNERYYFTEKDHSQFSFVTTNRFKEYEDTFFPPLQSQPADSIHVKPEITLCCFTVEKVLLSK